MTQSTRSNRTGHHLCSLQIGNIAHLQAMYCARDKEDKQRFWYYGTVYHTTDTVSASNCPDCITSLQARMNDRIEHNIKTSPKWPSQTTEELNHLYASAESSCNCWRENGLIPSNYISIVGRKNCARNSDNSRKQRKMPCSYRWMSAAIDCLLPGSIYSTLPIELLVRVTFSVTSRISESILVSNTDVDTYRTLLAFRELILICYSALTLDRCYATNVFRSSLENSKPAVHGGQHQAEEDISALQDSQSDRTTTLAAGIDRRSRESFGETAQENHVKMGLHETLAENTWHRIVLVEKSLVNSTLLSAACYTLQMTSVCGKSAEITGWAGSAYTVHHQQQLFDYVETLMDMPLILPVDVVSDNAATLHFLHQIHERNKETMSELAKRNVTTKEGQARSSRRSPSTESSVNNRLTNLRGINVRFRVELGREWPAISKEYELKFSLHTWNPESNSLIHLSDSVSVRISIERKGAETQQKKFMKSIGDLLSSNDDTERGSVLSKSQIAEVVFHQVPAQPVIAGTTYLMCTIYRIGTLRLKSGGLRQFLSSRTAKSRAVQKAKERQKRVTGVDSSIQRSLSSSSNALVKQTSRKTSDAESETVSDDEKDMEANYDAENAFDRGNNQDEKLPGWLGQEVKDARYRRPVFIGISHVRFDITNTNTLLSTSGNEPIDSLVPSELEVDPIVPIYSTKNKESFFLNIGNIIARRHRGSVCTEWKDKVSESGSNLDMDAARVRTLLKCKPISKFWKIYSRSIRSNEKTERNSDNEGMDYHVQDIMKAWWKTGEIDHKSIPTVVNDMISNESLPIAVWPISHFMDVKAHAFQSYRTVEFIDEHREKVRPPNRLLRACASSHVSQCFFKQGFGSNFSESAVDFRNISKSCHAYESTESWPGCGFHYWWQQVLAETSRSNAKTENNFSIFSTHKDLCANEFFFFLGSCSISQGSKRAKLNLQVRVRIVNQQGEVLPCILGPDVERTSSDVPRKNECKHEYLSTVYYHSNVPSFHEHIIIRLPAHVPPSEAHILLQLQHVSTTKGNSFPVCFGFLPLTTMNVSPMSNLRDSAVITPGTYSLTCFEPIAEVETSSILKGVPDATTSCLIDDTPRDADEYNGSMQVIPRYLLASYSLKIPPATFVCPLQAEEEAGAEEWSGPKRRTDGSIIPPVEKRKSNLGSLLNVQRDNHISCGIACLGNHRSDVPILQTIFDATITNSPLMNLESKEAYILPLKQCSKSSRDLAEAFCKLRMSPSCLGLWYFPAIMEGILKVFSKAYSAFPERASAYSRILKISEIIDMDAPNYQEDWEETSVLLHAYYTMLWLLQVTRKSEQADKTDVNCELNARKVKRRMNDSECTELLQWYIRHYELPKKSFGTILGCLTASMSTSRLTNSTKDILFATCDHLVDMVSLAIGALSQYIVSSASGIIDHMKSTVREARKLTRQKAFFAKFGLVFGDVQKAFTNLNDRIISLMRCNVLHEDIQTTLEGRMGILRHCKYSVWTQLTKYAKEIEPYLPLQELQGFLVKILKQNYGRFLIHSGCYNWKPTHLILSSIEPSTIDLVKSQLTCTESLLQYRPLSPLHSPMSDSTLSLWEACCELVACGLSSATSLNLKAEFLASLLCKRAFYAKTDEERNALLRGILAWFPSLLSLSKNTGNAGQENAGEDDYLEPYQAVHTGHDSSELVALEGIIWPDFWPAPSCDACSIAPPAYDQRSKTHRAIRAATYPGSSRKLCNSPNNAASQRRLNIVVDILRLVEPSRMLHHLNCTYRDNHRQSEIMMRLLRCAELMRRNAVKSDAIWVPQFVMAIGHIMRTVSMWLMMRRVYPVEAICGSAFHSMSEPPKRNAYRVSLIDRMNTMPVLCGWLFLALRHVCSNSYSTSCPQKLLTHDSMRSTILMSLKSLWGSFSFENKATDGNYQVCDWLKLALVPYVVPMLMHLAGSDNDSSDGLGSFARDIFFDLMYADICVNSRLWHWKDSPPENLWLLERCTIDAVDSMVSTGEGNIPSGHSAAGERGSRALEVLITPTTEGQKKLSRKFNVVSQLLNDVRKLFDMLVALRRYPTELPEGQVYEEERTTAALTLISYLRSTHRHDLFERYVSYLINMHQQLDNKAEAAMCQLLYVNMIGKAFNVQGEARDKLFSILECAMEELYDTNYIQECLCLSRIYSSICYIFPSATSLQKLGENLKRQNAIVEYLQKEVETYRNTRKSSPYYLVHYRSEHLPQHLRHRMFIYRASQGTSVAHFFESLREKCTQTGSIGGKRAGTLKKVAFRPFEDNDLDKDPQNFPISVNAVHPATQKVQEEIENLLLAEECNLPRRTVEYKSGAFSLREMDAMGLAANIAVDLPVAELMTNDSVEKNGLNERIFSTSSEASPQANSNEGITAIPMAFLSDSLPLAYYFVEQVTKYGEEQLDIYEAMTLQCCLAETLRYARHSSVPSQLRRIRDHSRVRVFTCDQPWKRSDSGNDALDIWIKRYILVTESAFPSISRRSAVYASSEQILNPFENSIEILVEKNEELQFSITRAKNTNDKVHFLTGQLKGVLDAAVSGGISNFEPLLSGDYVNTHPEVLDDIMEKNKRITRRTHRGSTVYMKMAQNNQSLYGAVNGMPEQFSVDVLLRACLRLILQEQMLLCLEGLRLHGQKCSDDMRPLHDHLCKKLDSMCQTLQQLQVPGTMTVAQQSSGLMFES